MSTEPTDEQLAWSEAPQTRRASVIAATGLLTSLLIATLTIIPSPYAIGTPGPTFDTLGEVEGVPLVSITGAPTYDTTGELRLTTVSEAPAGSTPFTVGQVVSAFFSSSSTVLPQELVFGDPDEEEQNDQESAEQWITSQEAATVAAIEALGQPVPATMTIVGVSPESNAAGLLEEDDVIVAVDGSDIATYSEFFDAIMAHVPGEEITVTVDRAGEEVDATFALLEGPGGRPFIGIFIDPVFEIPITVDVKIDDVGGPSGGTMFALAIMDMLTPGDELNGALVAGTGAIDANGDVIPIGGIQLKLLGARDAGAEYFIAPIENCDEVVGHIPDGLSVYAVDNLDDAYDVIVAIGRSETSTLPVCPELKDDK